MASEYLKWKYRDVKPDAPIERTKKQKAQNWWDYHKWPLLVGAVLLLAAGDILWHALGFGVVKPDYQFAYAASAPLGDETLSQLETALAALGEDASGDGRVAVKVNAYVSMSDSQDTDAARYAAAAQVKLMADMENRESYFFICDDPETLHDNYQILARADGTLADSSDQALWLRWGDCPALASLDVDQAEFENLYIARRGFWGERVCRYKEACDALWDALTEGAAS